jgi:hypothetical protein
MRYRTGTPLFSDTESLAEVCESDLSALWSPISYSNVEVRFNGLEVGGVSSVGLPQGFVNIVVVLLPSMILLL